MYMDPSATSIMLATSDHEERDRFIDLIETSALNYQLVIVESLRDVDQHLSDDNIQIIIADLSFAGGAFVDWLSLWPRPFVLLVSYGEEERLNNLIGDEACSFILRDDAYRHLLSLPIMIRKVLNVRESLNRQNVHFQISERRYLDLVSALPDIVYSLDATGNFMYVNGSVSQLGYTPTELIGKHFSVLIAEEDIAHVSRSIVLHELGGKETGIDGAPKLFDERRTGNRMTRNLEIRLRAKGSNVSNYSKGLVDSYGEVSSVGFVLPEYEGSLIGTVGIIRDISLRKKEMIRLADDVHMKETLLRELHHRVNNNLQIISSLLNIQSMDLADTSARELIHNFQAQIYVVAIVHEQLYKSENLQFIEMGAYITSLIGYISNSYESYNNCIKFSITCTEISLDIAQAIPIGLIINELLLNSIGDGVTRSAGSVTVSLDINNGNDLVLCVNDTGEGFPEGKRLESIDKKSAELITALSDQVGGKPNFAQDAGLAFMLVFPRPTSFSKRHF